MSLLEKLESMKTDLLNEKDLIDAQIAHVEGMVFDLESEKKASYELGFEEGLKQSGQAGGSDKIYSDEEMNAEIKPRDEKIAALEAKVVELEGRVDTTPFAQSDIDSAVVAAVEAASAPLKAQIANLSMSVQEREQMEETLAKQASDLSLAISGLTKPEVVTPVEPQPEVPVEPQPEPEVPAQEA